MKEEIVDKYGWQNTLNICMEEAGELVHALNKYQRAHDVGYATETNRSDARIDVVQAVADVKNAIDSVIYVLGIDEKEIEKEINRADERLMNLLEIRYEIKKNDEKQAKNEFHSEKCSIKNNDAYPETYWIEEIGGNEMKEEDISVGSYVYFISDNGESYPCRVIAYDSSDTEMPFLVSFGRNPNSAPGGAQWRLSRNDINLFDCIGKDVVFTHCGELATWARLDELQPRSPQRENCSSENNNAHDAVNHPSHYCRDGIECIDVIKATTKGMNAFTAFCQGNAIKYLFRWQYKNGVQDLKKARWYIDKLIEIQESSVNKKKE